MVRRILVIGSVCVWSFLTIPAALALVTSPVAQVATLALGVVPVVLVVRWMLTAHDGAGAGTDRPDTRAQERELLHALEQHGELTPTAAALRTSLTVDQACERLDVLARKGHVRTLPRDGMLVYVLHDAERRPPPPAPEPAATTEPVSNGTPPAAPCAEVTPMVEPLSERELEVLAHLAAGRSNKEIAAALVVSVGTVKTHTNNIYRKLGVHHRTEALVRAQCLHLI